MTLVQGALLGVLALVVIATGVGVVHAKFESRKLFVELQQLRETRDQIDVRWDRLQLEMESWGNHTRVSNLARDRLQMRAPKPDEVVVIRR